MGEAPREIVPSKTILPKTHPALDPRLKGLLLKAKRQQQSQVVSGWVEKERLLLEECHPKQRAFVLDPGKRVAALTARGAGKTTAVRARYLRRCQNIRAARCLYIATTRDQASEFMWEPLKVVCEKLRLNARFAEQKLKCTFKESRSFIRLVGADDKKEIEKLRGQPFHEVWIDESASHPHALLQALLLRIIGPRLGDFGGMLGLVGTPGHVLKGMFYEVTKNGSKLGRRWDERDNPEFKSWIKWSTHHWNLSHGAPFIPAMQRLWAEALEEKERNGWSDDNPIWRREYLGLWAADDTEMVYKYRAFIEKDGVSIPWNQWDPKKDEWGFAELPPQFKEWHYTYGMDLGHSDPFALQVLAWCPHDPDKVLYHVYEYERTGMYAKKVAELLTGEEYVQKLLMGKLGGLEQPGGLIGKTDWPDAMWADLAGLGEMVTDELKNVYGIPVQAAEKKNKFDAIELFNGDLIDGRVKVMKDSHLEAQLSELQWDVDEFGRLKENKGQPNHSTDAAIYARRGASHLWTEDEPKKPKVEKPKEVSEEPADDGDWDGKPLTDNEFAGILDDGNYPDEF